MVFPESLIETVKGMVGGSRYIFVGTVETAENTTKTMIGSFPSSGARVERVLRSSPTLHGFSGQVVTILATSVDGGASSRRVYFTNPVIYGEILSVKQVGSIEVPEDIDELQSLLDKLVGEMRMDDLRLHMISAEAVIHGNVLRTYSISRETSATVSEHDQDWHGAALHIIGSIKGKHSGELVIRYPNSNDVRWYAVPKPKVGQKAVFILHRDGLYPDEAPLTILHPTDMLVVDAKELHQIESMLPDSGQGGETRRR